MNEVIIRIKNKNNRKINPSGNYIVYWVQTGLRIDYNYSFVLAIDKANELNKPLLVYFALKENKIPNLRQYNFLKEGIIDFKKNLEKLGGNFLVEKVDSFEKILEIAKKSVLVVTDFGYLKNQRFVRNNLYKKIEVPIFEVENDTFLPINLLASEKINFAFQIRKKVFEAIPYFAKNFYINELKNKSKIVNQSKNEIEKMFSLLKLDKNVFKSKFVGGETQANLILNDFIENKLPYYKKYHSDPSKDFQSNLSPYLHFGFISPVKIVFEILKKYLINDENVISFFNELLVWRELSRNFVYFEKNYDNWKNLPKWAIDTLDKHRLDKRQFIYNLNDLENAKTHDKYWNACQKELIFTGKMHGYMRMYWAKKVIEWTRDWRMAYDWLIYLNDKYELDGRDPNGYAGIAWSFGQFDHPWKERKIFGLVRYMNDKGLERKFDMKAYLKKISLLEIHKKELLNK